MPFSPQPFVEHPNLRAPIALVVDDPAPCINPLWYFRHQVDGQSDPAHERTIPLDFMQDWCRFVEQTAIRGCFTVLPYPAGLGRIDDALEGYDPEEVRSWVALAREHVAPRFDIHAEILTHTNVLDLTDRRLRDISEHDWTATQDEAALADYFTAALQILSEAGLPSHGLTQPCYYHGDESLYARALLVAEKRVYGRSVTHNFLHMDSVAPAVPPRITHLDAAAGEAVVSIWTGTNDAFWNTQERGAPEQGMTPEELADRHLTEDGHGGRLAELLAGGGPLVMVTHWQSLYSNGTHLGLRACREVAARVAALWGDRVAWRKLSEISEHFLAARTVRFESQATPDIVEVTATAPFATDTLTVSIPMPWPLEAAPTVWIGGQPASQAADPSALTAGSWVMRGSLLTASLPLQANVAVTIRVRRS